MKRGLRIHVLSAVILSAAVLESGSTAANGSVEERSTVLGPKLRVGGKYDNVRMCVASPAGADGGPTADVSLSASRKR